VALVLLINNVRDIAHDVRQDIRTLPMLIGRTNGVRLYVGIIAAAYLGVLLMAVFGPLSLWSFSVLASLPLASKLLGTMRRSIPDDADARTAQLNTAFGLLLLLSLVPGAVC
jgi:1,4-dihydroxy-2-naphthoate octaprenyltransferase